MSDGRAYGCASCKWLDGALLGGEDVGFQCSKARFVGTRFVSAYPEDLVELLSHAIECPDYLESDWFAMECECE